jgi:acetyl-CoA carboxylase carboxyltransferase component
MPKDWEVPEAELQSRRAAARSMGGEEAVVRLHARGKLSARERLDMLMDPGSFNEIGLLVEGEVVRANGEVEVLHADSVVTGWGEIDGRKVFVVADDGSVMAGAAGLLNVEKRFRIRRMAVEQGYPFVGLYEGSAIRFQDSMDAAIMARVPAFREVLDCVGVVPQVAAIMGPAFGRPPMDVLYSELALQIAGTGHLGLSGPALVKGGIGEDTDIESLAGPEMHADATGMIDLVAPDEATCLADIRRFLHYMPANAWELPPRGESDGNRDRPCPELKDIVPTNLRQPYDVNDVIAVLADRGSLFPYKVTFGRSVVTTLARIDGHVVGVVANQPSHQGGVIDADGAFKARRFVALCDLFHIPLLFLQDQPGFLPGPAAEANRIVFWAGSLLATVERATVPKVTVIMRKSHGAACWALGKGGRSAEAGDIVFAWPIAIMTGTGPSSAVYTVHARELAAADDPETRRHELEAGYNRSGSVYGAAAAFGIDDVIAPEETRRRVIAALEMASGRLTRNLGPKTPLFP